MITNIKKANKNRHVKLLLYGEPGSGKSVFASNSPRPFFYCTDGNFEFLDLPEENHIELTSWIQFEKDLATRDFSQYDTIVVDLLEDLFKFQENEFCKQNNIQHVSDLGYGKGYSMSRDAFLLTIFKLISLPKNIILIMHGITTVQKDRRGVEYTLYKPSDRLPDKVLDSIEGRVRFALRAFSSTEEDANEHLVTKYILSLSPASTSEYGIARNLPANSPRNIKLDWNVFCETIGLNNLLTESEYEEPTIEEEIQNQAKEDAELKIEDAQNEKIEDEINKEAEITKPTLEAKVDFQKPIKIVDDVVKEENLTKTLKVEEPIKTQPVSQEDKLAAIKAKMAEILKKE